MKQIILILLLSILSFADNMPSKEQLHNVILNQLPESMCQENNINTECFSITIQECKTLVTKLVTPCFQKYENKFNDNITREQFLDTANNIGQCVGTEYSETLQKEGKLDLVCFYLPKWLK